MIVVALYSKEDCRLCDEAKVVLENVRKEIPFELRVVTIAPGDAFFEAYRESIPVVTINDVPAFRYRVDEQKLRRALQELSG